MDGGGGEFGGTILGGGMSHALESNVFQWRNLYIHRFGVCSYPPPMPKDPSTTARNYPTTASLMALRQLHGVQTSSGGDSAGEEQSTPRSVLQIPTAPAAAIAAPAAAAVEAVLGKTFSTHPPAASAVASVVGTSFQQRRAEMERQKKLQREEAIRQNPHRLAPSILRMHQAAWRLIMDDAIVCQSNKLSLEYSQLAHFIESHVQKKVIHGSRSAGSMASGGYRRGPHPQMASKRASVISSIHFQYASTDYARTAGLGLSISSNNEEDDPFSSMPDFPEAVEALACGPDHVLQLPLKDESVTASALYEFAPFFVSVSPHADVSNTESRLRAQKFLTLPDMHSGGDQSELLGLPMFSQFSSWQDAYQRRVEWPLAPFHFFITHDVSYNFAHCAAVLTLLEMYAKHRHLHIPDASQVTVKSMVPRRKKKSLPDVHKRQSLAFSAPPGESSLEAQTSLLSMPNFEMSENNTNSIAEPVLDDRQESIIRLLILLDRTSSSFPKILCNRTPCCVSSSTSGSTGVNKLHEKRALVSSCPLLAFETSIEDLLIIFENSSNRSAFRMLFAVFHYYLEKAMRPGQAARQLLTPKHIFPFENQEKLAKVVTALQEHIGRQRRGQQRQSNTKGRLYSVAGAVVSSDSDDDIPAEKEGDSPSLLKDDEEDDVAAKLSVFSELEFNALFHLAGYFVDLGQQVKPVSRPSVVSQSREASQQLRQAHVLNMQATATFAEAVVRFEAVEQQRLERKRLVAQLTANLTSHTSLNIAKRVKLHEEAEAAEEEKAGPYKDAASLAFPMILLGSYMRLHGSTWIRQITANVVNYLSKPDVRIYVTDSMLEDPTLFFNRRGEVLRSDTQRENSVKDFSKTMAFASKIAETLNRKKGDSSPVNRASVVSTTPQQEMLDKSVLLANPMSSDDFLPLTREGAGSSSAPGTPQPVSLTPSVNLADPADPQRFRGYPPHEQEMFALLEAAEEQMCAKIEHALRLFFSDLERSHFFQRIPPGISRLTTELCSTIHAQLLSGIIVLPPDKKQSGSAPSGTELVELYISTLLGEKRRGNRQAAESEEKVIAAPAKKQRGGVTIVEDTVSTPFKHKHSEHFSMSSKDNDVGSGKKGPPPEVETNITLITDIRRYRLAKFVLFDSWILPTLNNALRYHIVDESAGVHVLRNLDALARYIKIVLNGPFVAREMDRRSSNLQATNSTDGFAARSNKNATNPRVVLQPYLSGVYNASTGGLIQLFRPPVEVDHSQSDDDASSNADSDVSSRQKRVRSGSGAHTGHRRRSTRRSSSVSSDDNVSSAKKAMSSIKVVAKLSVASKSARRRSSVKVNTKPNSTRELGNALRSALSFQPQTEQWWPKGIELSPALLRLNMRCGTLAQHASPASASTSTAAQGEGPDLPTLVNTFCWRVSTFEDTTFMMPEYVAPPTTVAAAVETLHSIVTGKHSAVKPRSPLVNPNSLDDAGMSYESGSDASSENAGDSQVPFDEEEGRAQFIRVLHSVLHFPTFASTFLENINSNNKKLFMYLVKPSSSLGSALSTATTKYTTAKPFAAQSPSSRPEVKLTDYSYLWTALSTLMVKREVPLVDVNSVLSVVSLASERSASGTSVLPPPSLTAAYLRLTQRQQFVTTGLPLPMWGGASSTPSEQEAGFQPDLAFTGVAQALFPAVGQKKSQESLQDPSECPFHSFFSGLTIALCTKAAAVIEECSQKHSNEWVRKCNRHKQRSLNEQMALQQLTCAETPLLPSAPVESQPKKRKVATRVTPPVSAFGPKPPVARVGGSSSGKGRQHKSPKSRMTQAASSHENGEPESKYASGAHSRPVMAERWVHAVASSMTRRSLAQDSLDD